MDIRPIIGAVASQLPRYVFVSRSFSLHSASRIPAAGEEEVRAISRYDPTDIESGRQTKHTPGCSTKRYDVDANSSKWLSPDNIFGWVFLLRMTGLHTD